VCARVSHLTPSQKLISIAAMWEWTLFDLKQMGMESVWGRRGSVGGDDGLRFWSLSVSIKTVNNQLAKISWMIP
jgi:hypothetical protein